MPCCTSRARCCCRLNPHHILRLLQLPAPQLDELGRAVWGVSASELGRAYRRLSILVHPDKHPGPEARTAFEQLKAAYNELRDPGKLVRRSAGRGCARAFLACACAGSRRSRSDEPLQQRLSSRGRIAAS